MQQMFRPAHFGHLQGGTAPPRKRHSCRQSRHRIVRAAFVETFPPSIRKAFPWVKASATFLRADSTIRPRVCRETPIRAAACAWYSPLKSVRQIASSSSTCNTTSYRDEAGTPQGSYLTQRGIPATLRQQHGLGIRGRSFLTSHIMSICS